MLYLWIARHGLTQHNVDGIIQGHYDTDLNEEGREQAELLSRWLETNAEFDYVLTSPLKRARDTALAIYHRQPYAKLAIDESLIERDMGAWNNHKVVRPKKNKPKKEGTRFGGPEQELDAPEEKADGSLGPVKLEEKPERQGRSAERTAKPGRVDRVSHQQLPSAENRKSHEQARHQDINIMMGQVEIRGEGEPSSRDPAGRDSSHGPALPALRRADPKHDGTTVKGSTKDTARVGETNIPKAKKTIRPPRPQIPGMETREDLMKRCEEWASRIISRGTLKSKMSDRDIHIIAVSHGAFISCLLDVLTWPLDKGGSFGFGFDSPQDQHCYNTSFSIAKIDLNGKGLFLYNNHIPHLEPEATTINPDDFAQ